jgi:hypothetical protein
MCKLGSSGASTLGKRVTRKTHESSGIASRIVALLDA